MISRFSCACGRALEIEVFSVHDVYHLDQIAARHKWKIHTIHHTNGRVEAVDICPDCATKTGAATPQLSCQAFRPTRPASALPSTPPASGTSALPTALPPSSSHVTNPKHGAAVADSSGVALQDESAGAVTPAEGK